MSGLSETNTDRIIEKERERITQQKKVGKMLYFRNILNSIFIILALVAMIGLLVSSKNPNTFYIIGLVAVGIKMIEVVLRMPLTPKNLKTRNYDK